MDSFEAHSLLGGAAFDETGEHSATRTDELGELTAGTPDVASLEETKHGALAHGPEADVVRNGEDTGLNTDRQIGVIRQADKDALFKRLNAGLKDRSALVNRVGASGYSSSGLAVAVGEDADGVSIGFE